MSTENAKNEQFIGVKIVEATPMTRGEYNQYRGWELPKNEEASDEGFLVEYTESLDSNDDRHAGYISWCPAEQFRLNNRPCSGMPFGHAIEAAKKGKKIARAGWNGKNMFVVMMPALKLPPFNTQDTNRKVNDRTAKWIGEDAPLNCVPYFAMYAANGDWVPGWLASQTDMLADDWMIV